MKKSDLTTVNAVNIIKNILGGTGEGQPSDGTMKNKVWFGHTHTFGNTTKLNLDMFTGERGARTDHGGGESGEGHMDTHQIGQEAAPFRSKWDAKLAKAKKALEDAGFNCEFAALDYGEKGHISLQIGIIMDAPKPKKEKAPKAEKAPKTEVKETPEKPVKKEEKKEVKKEEKPRTTVNIDCLPGMPELKIGDSVKVVRKHKSGKEVVIEGTIKRFFHHNKLDRNEAQLVAPDKSRKFVLESELVAVKNAPIEEPKAEEAPKEKVKETPKSEETKK